MARERTLRRLVESTGHIITALIGGIADGESDLPVQPQGMVSIEIVGSITRLITEEEVRFGLLRFYGTGSGNIDFPEPASDNLSYRRSVRVEIPVGNALTFRSTGGGDSVVVKGLNSEITYETSRGTASSRMFALAIWVTPNGIYAEPAFTTGGS